MSSAARRAAGRAAGEGGLDQFPAAADLPGTEVIVGGAQDPGRSFRGWPGWRHPHGLLGQHRRRLRRAPGGRVPRRGVEQAGDLPGGAVGTKRQMPRLFLDVPGAARQPAVHVPALAHRHLGVQDRPEQRMGEPQRVAVAPDQAVVDDLVHRRPGVLVAVRRPDHVLARVGGGGDQPADPQRVRGQAAQPGADQVADPGGDGYGLASGARSPPLQQRPPAFQGVERVTAARLVEPSQGGPGEGDAEPGPQDRPDGTRAQPAQLRARQAGRGQRLLQPEREHRILATEGQQDRDRRLVQAADAELQGLRRRPVQPLRVIHRQ